MGEEQKSPKLIAAVVKTFDILACFQKKEELGVSEIAGLLGKHKSTVFGLISTLEHLNILEKVEDTRKYRLGLELFKLGSLVSLDIRHTTRYDLECLQADLNETVHLARRHDLSILFLERFEAASSMRVYTIDAKPLPIYATASGKAILSTMDDRELKGLLDRMRFEVITEKTILSRERLLEEVREARRNGFAVDNEELEDGLFCIGAPLYDLSGKADYAISVSGPKVRTGDRKYSEITEKILKTAAEISRKLGFQGQRPF